METEIIAPHVSNFIKSLRDIGYTLEISVADILDNSISADASYINIYATSVYENLFAILDDGIGMSGKELVEAMRLATKNPDLDREKNDLGRFGLGLKTASFSQCKQVTVITKKNNLINARQWDLDYIEQENDWALITPPLQQFENIPLYEDLKSQEHGTLVIWKKIDSYTKDELPEQITKLRKHLSLVFHRFIERTDRFKALTITINNSPLESYNPFNINHPATQQMPIEKLKIYDETISVQPFILPHHSKVAQKEYEYYATDEGYTKSQGFYLYRGNRLLIHGTWWGLHRATDAHKLVRIKIDIPNNQDRYWGIDIMKSTANPIPELRNDLKRIVKQITERGSRPYSSRGRRIEDRTTTRFWEIVAEQKGSRFALNSNHPLLEKIKNELSTDQLNLINLYLKGIQAYLPLEAIQAQLQQNPHEIKQEIALDEEEIKVLVEKLKLSNLDQSYIESLLKTEIFKNNKELLKDV